MKVKKMKEEKISIIIPIYNAEKYIERCLKSIINQTYQNLEILVINDGSTDGTIKYIEEIKKNDERIIIINKNNEGVSIARNIGISQSTGKYITFIDADDWLEPNAIEILYDEIKKNNVDIVRGNYYRNYDENNMVQPNNYISKYENIKLNEDNYINNFIEDLYLERIPCYVWLLMIKREIIFNKIFFPSKISMMEDTIFYLRMLYKYKEIYISDKKIYHYFCNENSACKSVSYLERNINDAINVSKIIKKIVMENEKKFAINIKKINGLCIRRVLRNMYRIFVEQKQDIKEIYKRLKSEEDFANFIKNKDVSEFSTHERLMIEIFDKGTLSQLKLYFKLRSIFGKWKMKKTKRLE